MNIKILDSWLREYLKTTASARDLAEKLSLTSLSVEKLEKKNSDFLYEFEITTNRPDLYSVLGIAREANAVLHSCGIKSEFNKPSFKTVVNDNPFPIEIINDPKIVNRICAVVLEVKVGDSPSEIKERLEVSGIRSLNNIIDITNYVMRVIGHPAHVFDLDRLNTKKLYIKQAQRGQKIKTLDEKEHVLQGEEIVALNDRNEIVDLLGIMGLENSVVTDNTKRILFFIDNNNPSLIRKASMGLAIRTEAATLNEKGIDPELARQALNFGVELYQKISRGKILSKVLDIYPNKPEKRSVNLSLEKVKRVIGIDIDLKKLTPSLERLGFKLSLSENNLKVEVPSYRLNDIKIEEDVIEEIARIYGYHNLPSQLPQTTQIIPHQFVDNFYWETRVKNTLKNWGFTEMYTYSFVSEELYEGDEKDAVKIKNPLTEDFVFMRRTIVPSLLRAVSENKSKEEIKIFEMANVYIKKTNDLPDEILTLAGVIKKNKVSFYEVKGIVEQLLIDFRIKNYSFKNSEKSGVGASVFIGKYYIGEVEVLDHNLINFELNFEELIKHANLTKKYKPIAKYPPIIEDLAFIVPESVQTIDMVHEIQKINSLIVEVSLLDQFANFRTFHIVYQDPNKNLTTKGVSEIREKIINFLSKKFSVKIK